MATVNDVGPRAGGNIRVASPTSPAEFQPLCRQGVAHMTLAMFLAEVIGDPSGRPGDSRLLEVNPAFETISGLKRDAVIGRTLREVLPTAGERLLQTCGRVAFTGEPEAVEWSFDGAHRRHYEVIAYSPIRGQVACIFTDVTERKRAEETVRRSAAILTHAGRLANLGAWDIELRDLDDLMRDPLHWSEQAFRIFGYEPGEVRVTNEVFFERVHPDDRARVAEAFAQAVAERRAYSIEHRVVHRDGSERTVYEYADVILDREGRPYRVTGAVQDITDRRRAEEALRQANAQLAEADRRKDEFLAMLSHELRNPLAPIRYAVPALRREPLSDVAVRTVAVIARQVDHLTRLVDDLLDVSRITRGTIELRRTHVTLGAIVEAAIEAAAPAIEAARHRMETTLAEEPIWLHADPDRIAQVITNLLNNAAKYTPRGGRITLTAGLDNGQAVIRIRDSGCGIPPEWISAIFDMFRQGPRLDRAQGGLGIGLALVKQLVQMHGGTITAHSAGAGHGAEFIVRLPTVGEAPTPRRAETRTQETDVGRPLKVLVVDDNVDLVEMLAMIVTELGHDVRKALDGRTAIAAAVAYRPDVVLLDLGLPVIGGIDVARELRQRPETAGARLIALTGWGQAEDRARTREAGFDEHLTKPTDPSTLTRLLTDIALSLAGDLRPR